MIFMKTSIETHLADVNVHLFSLVTVLAFINAFILNICHPLLVFMNRQTSEERVLEQRRHELLDEQSELNMTNQFAKYSKLQRQINAIDAELDEYRQNRSIKSTIKRIAVQHGLKVLFGLVLLIISVYYRNKPVFILGEQYNLYPFTSVISYPNKKLNAVSVHTWILCCTAFTQLLKNI